MDIPSMSWTGFQVGLGIAVIPAVATSLIACSKIILVNIIADIVIRILTLNTFSASVSGISFVEVPLLWKASFIAAVVGGTIMALSVIAALAESIYQRYAVNSRE